MSPPFLTQIFSSLLSLAAFHTLSSGCILSANVPLLRFLFFLYFPSWINKAGIRNRKRRRIGGCFRDSTRTQFHNVTLFLVFSNIPCPVIPWFSRSFASLTLFWFTKFHPLPSLHRFRPVFTFLQLIGHAGVTHVIEWVPSVFLRRLRICRLTRQKTKQKRVEASNAG